MVSAEDKVAAAREWFDQVSNIPAAPFPAYHEPESPAPMDLRHVDQVVMQLAMSIHRCANCDRGIHVGWPQVSYRPLATHHFTLYFHESCAILR